MNYIHAWEKLDIDIASEYLVMAATLMEIKSKSLLPNVDSDNVEEDSFEDNRETLIQKLIDYERYKEVTKDFKKLENERQKVYTKAPLNLNEMFHEKFVNDTDTTVDDLMGAFMDFLKRKYMEKPITTKITNKEYSIKKRKNDIKDFLTKKKKFEFTELFDNYNRSYIIVTFLALLELIKENCVVVKQSENFSKIMIEEKV